MYLPKLTTKENSVMNTLQRTKHLSKKGDWKRKWRSFERHALLVLVPFVIALGAVGIWYQLRKQGIYFSKDDEIALTGGAIATLAIAFSLMAAVVLNTIWENYRKIVVCVLEKDVQTFLYYRMSVFL